MIISMTQADDKMLATSLLGSGLYTQVAEGGESRVRRRRRKSKGGAAGEEAKKRRLSAEQVKFLEMNFGTERKLESGRKVHLASELGLDPKQVAVWFQNRRARWKNKQLEEEFMKLKSLHENVALEKYHLETEVLKLKERLSEAEKEIKKLSTSSDGGSCSPSSSLSMDTQQPFLGEEFGLGLSDDLMCIQGYNYINMVDWVNSLYGI